jgi:hypothetical protein
MKRLVGPTFNLATALSFLLCAASGLLYLRSQFRSDHLGYAGWENHAASTWHGWGLQTHKGQLSAYYFTGQLLVYDPSSVGDTNPDPNAKNKFFYTIDNSSQPASKPFRFETIDPRWVIPFKLNVAAVPLWFLIAIFALLPGSRAIKRILSRRKPRIARGFDILPASPLVHS